MVELEQKAVELLDKFDALTTQYTPEVIEGASKAIQVTAIGNIVCGVIGLAAACMVWWMAKNLAVYCRKREKKDGTFMSNWDEGWLLCFVGGVLTCSVLSIVAVLELTDVWNWVAVFNPHLAMAHVVLGL